MYMYNKNLIKHQLENVKFKANSARRDGEKLMNFNTGNTKGTDHCIIGNISTPSDNNSHLIGCIGEIIGFYKSLTDKETSYIHKYLIKKWGDATDPI